MRNILAKSLHGRWIKWAECATWILLTVLFEFGWGALMYVLPQFVPDVQVPLLMLIGIVAMLVAVALAGFAAIPFLMFIAVDEGIAWMCKAKECA